MTSKWCENYRSGSYDYEICLSWVCVCGHSYGNHANKNKCGECECVDEQFSHNNDCSLECQILYKLKEI